MQEDNVLVHRVAKSWQQEPELAGFPWSLVIGIVIQVAEYVVKCYMNREPAEESTTPQELVTKRYVDGKYDARLIAAMSRRVHAAARRNGVRLSRSQGRLASIRALDEIRLGTQEEVLSACSLPG